MSPAVIKPRRPRAFEAVSTGLMVGHGLMVIVAIVAGVLILIRTSSGYRLIMPWDGPLRMGLVSAPLFHIALMLVTPVWNGLAARRQTKASRLWAWLGYVIPLAGYWFPAHNLRQLVDGAAPDATRLRTLILAWGIARNLASPLVVIIVVYGLYKLGPTSKVTAGIAAVYVLLSFIAANLLSLIMISQVRRYLDTGAVDERHAEVFS